MRHVIVLCLSLLLLVPAASAQDTSIEINGVIESMDDDTIVVNGLPITVSGLDTALTSQLVTGATIRISGDLQNGTVIAITIEIINLPDDADAPSITLEKFVSRDGSGWRDADNAPGPEFELDDEVSFRFVVFNDGNVPLTNLALSDDTFATSTCSLPAELAPGATFECVIGPFPVEAGQHTNIATITATAAATSVTSTDSANYFGGDLDDVDDDGGSADQPVIIVIEGPVQNININIITIYDIDIEVNVNDPILNIIQIGDVIRVEGDLVDDSDTIIIIAITIIIIDIDIYVSDDGTEVWRDDGNCSNGPPPWAPAHGWRRKCEGGGSGGGSGRGSNKASKKS